MHWRNASKTEKRTEKYLFKGYADTVWTGTVPAPSLLHAPYQLFDDRLVCGNGVL